MRSCPGPFWRHLALRVESIDKFSGTGRVNVFATTPTLVAGIRPDMIGMDSSGIGFVTHDSTGFRLLTSADTGAGFLYLNPTGIYLGTATPAIVAATGGTVSNAAAGSNVDLTALRGLYSSTTGAVRSPT